MLEEFAREQERTRQWGRAFDRKDVESSFAGEGRPPWERFSDPWQFYAPIAIHQRQIRWRDEASRKSVSVPAARHATFVRSDPKVGRNDPCPCGSGKKSKKCCLT